jgi:hypothetical protein
MRFECGVGGALSSASDGCCQGFGRTHIDRISSHQRHRRAGGPRWTRALLAADKIQRVSISARPGTREGRSGCAHSVVIHAAIGAGECHAAGGGPSKFPSFKNTTSLRGVLSGMTCAEPVSPSPGGAPCGPQSPTLNVPSGWRSFADMMHSRRPLGMSPRTDASRRFHPTPGGRKCASPMPPQSRESGKEWEGAGACAGRPHSGPFAQTGGPIRLGTLQPSLPRFAAPQPCSSHGICLRARRHRGNRALVIGRFGTMMIRRRGRVAPVARCQSHPPLLVRSPRILRAIADLNR